MSAEHDAPRGPSTRRVGMIVGAVLFGIGLLVIGDNIRLGAGWSRDGPQKPCT